MTQIIARLTSRGDTEANWTSNNPVLSAKEIAFSTDAFYTGTDQQKFKVGDGVQTWTQLDYMPIGVSVQTLAQTLTNGNKTGELTIESDNGKSILSILNALSTMVFQDGAIFSSAKVSSTNAALDFTDGVNAGGFYVFASKNEMVHNVSNEITAPENYVTGHSTLSGNTSIFSDGGEAFILHSDSSIEARKSFLGGNNKILINDVAAYLISTSGFVNSSIYADAVNGNHMVSTVKNVLDAPINEVTSTGSNQDRFKVFGSDLQNKVILGTDSFNGGNAKFYDSSESETVTITGESGVVSAFVYNHPTETASVPLSLDSGKNIKALTASIWGAFINSLTGKTTPADADQVVLMDSADSNKAKKLSWANLMKDARRINKDIRKTQDAAAVTGTVAETIMDYVLVPGGRFTSDDIIYVENRIKRSTVTGTSTVRIRVNTSNSLVGATLVATGSLNNTILVQVISRNMVIKSSTNTEVFGAATSFGNDAQSSTVAVSSLNIDWSVDQYILVTTANGSVGESTVSSYVAVEKR